MANHLLAVGHPASSRAIAVAYVRSAVRSPPPVPAAWAGVLPGPRRDGRRRRGARTAPATATDNTNDACAVRPWPPCPNGYTRGPGAGVALHRRGAHPSWPIPAAVLSAVGQAR